MGGETTPSPDVTPAMAPATATATATAMAPATATMHIHTSLLFDARAARFVRNRSIALDAATGSIVAVRERPSDDLPDDAEDDNNNNDNDNDSDNATGAAVHIDARGLLVAPGLVDSHTHIFLHAYREAAAIHQERDESLVERIVRATQHCRSALKAGYTTYRDLGTEAGGDADVGLRDAINRGLMPGPRLFVATMPLASSGSYATRHESALNGTVVPPLADACDGVDGVTAGVRRRLAAGADLVKFYADYRRRALRFPPPAYPGGPDLLFPPPAPLRSPNSPLYSQAEMDAICAEARRAGCPVAAHATEPRAVIMAANAGVTSIEHGFLPSPDVVAHLRAHDTIFVPTLAVAHLFRAAIDRGLFGDVTWPRILARTHALWNAGVRIAAGGDTGAFPHGDNIREVELLVDAGLPLEAALQAATIRGWEACGGNLRDVAAGEAVVGRKFGCVEPGWAADLVAFDPAGCSQLEALRRVKWVIKDGRFVVKDGQIYEPWS